MKRREEKKRKEKKRKEKEEKKGKEKKSEKEEKKRKGQRNKYLMAKLNIPLYASSSTSSDSLVIELPVNSFCKLSILISKIFIAYKKPVRTYTLIT